MKNILLFSLIFYSFIAYGQTTVWEKTFNDNIQGINCQIKANDGNFIFAGMASDVFGQSDIYVQKIDLNGNSLWKTNLGGNLEDVVVSMVEDGSGGAIIVSKSISNSGLFDVHYGPLYIGPDRNYDLWITHIDYTGVIQWNKHIGGSGQEATAKILKYNSGFLLAVNTNSVDYDFLNTDASKNDVWVMNFSNAGNELWKTKIMGNEDENLSNLKILNNEICVLINSNSSDGDFSASNSTNLKIGYLIKLNSVGQVTKSIPIIDSSLNPAFNNIIDIEYSTGNYFILGTEANSINDASIFAASYKEDGTINWKKYQQTIFGAKYPRFFFYQNNKITVLSYTIQAISPIMNISIYDEQGNTIKESQQNYGLADALMFPNNSFIAANYQVYQIPGRPYQFTASLYDKFHNLVKNKIISLPQVPGSGGTFLINSINQNEIILFYYYGKKATSPNGDENTGLHIIRLSLDGLLSVNERQDAVDIKISPNPSSDFIKLSKKADQITIYTVDGKLVKSFSNTDQIKVSTFLTGIYYLKAYFNEEIKTFRFIKK